MVVKTHEIGEYSGQWSHNYLCNPAAESLQTVVWYFDDHCSTAQEDMVCIDLDHFVYIVYDS
ncbi:hypothetical protein AM1_C0228 (plasmid) [Acaryochloris marina MBIC11017]|uniref:Uncharacterized protein n=1 Tax=Acaryochloris marina (strain MBIC 11017) TaxID=329726 RepID=A8ZMW3_ACAM1|nr:hypothetical protein AM1_C0228 [Acaryochloris marina MBIC11017]